MANDEEVVLITPNSPLNGKNPTDFRNYTQTSVANDRVSNFYHQNRKMQTMETVLKKKNTICKLEKCEMSIWEAAELLNELVDESDPDTESGQIIHLLQTAEAIRKEYPGPEYDWFHLTGFIHDLGKVLNHPTMYNEPQWAVVGDTFPIGCEFASTNVHGHFYEENPDSQNPRYNTKYGIYSEGIGLDKVQFSFGHDEYLYQVCVQNKSTLPEEALYIIRYHSFYPWHSFGSYSHLTNEKDKEMLEWVKTFQKFDLYSKLPTKPNVEQLVPYYKSLIRKYFPDTLKW
jgi:inositol oxygenase